MLYQPQPALRNDVTKRAFFLEFLGCFLICYFGGWGSWMADLGYINVGFVSIQVTFTVAFCVWFSASTTGAQFNGAVTMA